MHAFPSRRLALASFALVLLCSRPAAAWQSHYPEALSDSFALAVAFGPDGSVVAGGIEKLGGDQGHASVEKLASDGTLVWRKTVDPWGSRTLSVAVSAAGDVLAGGLAGGLDEDTFGHFTAVRLAAATGAEVWRYEPTETVDGKMLVDPTGDVLASVTVIVDAGGPDQDYATECRKLSGADGSLLWQRDACADVGAVAANGDLYVGNYGFVAKVSGADGHEIWRTAPADAAGGQHLAIDSRGDVFAARNAEVVKLSGADGTIVWRQGFRGFDEVSDGIRAITTDASGDVIVAGKTAYVSGKGSDMLVGKLDGRDGRRRWRRRVHGARESRLSIERAMGVGVDAAGDVIVSGELGPRAGESGIVVMKLKSKNGRPLWTRHPEGTGGRCWALAVDPLGSSAIAGGIGPAAVVGAGSFFVTRLDPTGDGSTPVLVQ